MKMRPVYKFDPDIMTNEFALRFYIKSMMRNQKTLYRRFKYFLYNEYGWSWRGPVTTMKYEYILPMYLDFMKTMKQTITHGNLSELNCHPEGPGLQIWDQNTFVPLIN